MTKRFATEKAVNAAFSKRPKRVGPRGYGDIHAVC
jgi:hypothetical protein